MEDLAKQLKDKAGLTDEQVVITIQTMKEYIHTKVPPMFSGFVDKFFAKNNLEPDDDPLA